MKRTLRQRIGAGIAGAGLVSMAIGALATPSVADPIDNGACNGAFNGNPEGTLAISTDPAAGSDIFAGGTVTVTATWATTDWNGLNQLFDCVELDGVLAEGLSDQEKPPVNDGSYVHQFTVPADTAPDTEVCVRARLSGQPVNPPGNEEPVTTQKSNTACIRVQAAPTTTTAPPTTTTSAPQTTTTTTVQTTTSTTALQATVTTTPQTTATTGPAAEVAGNNASNTSVAGNQVATGGNAEVLGNQLEALDTLPRTGTSTPVLLFLAGLALLLGGAAVGFGKPYTLD